MKFRWRWIQINYESYGFLLHNFLGHTMMNELRKRERRRAPGGSLLFDIGNRGGGLFQLLKIDETPSLVTTFFRASSLTIFVEKLQGVLTRVEMYSDSHNFTVV